MMWMHWLQRLNDPSQLCSTLVNRKRSKWAWSVGASPGSELLMDYMIQMLCDLCPGLFNPWLTGGGVNVASSVEASLSSELLVD